MYSLYRAWLSLGPSCPLPPLPPSSTSAQQLLNLTNHVNNGAPDICLQVGPSLTQFSAHRSVLSAHSGFFKAALLNQQDQNSPIIVPNINIDEFSSLLTFMYTGYLDLNLCNIYSILLATHILHMPRALELCRSFLLQNHAPSTPLSPPPPPTLPTHQHHTIIKPIPSRKPPILLNNSNNDHFPPKHHYPPLSSTTIASESSPFKLVASTSKTTTTPTTNEKMQIETIGVSSSSSNCKKIKRKNQQTTNESGIVTCGNVAEKVIIDIACCDGPVRFHRVINKNYGQAGNTGAVSQQIGDLQLTPQNTAAMNAAMNENIRQKQQFDENVGDVATASTSNEHFTCLYCNHTFKSQYCYQKHARRHLNPVTLEKQTDSIGIVATVQQQSSSSNDSIVCHNATGSSNSKREVKLLDMNVQYYPCKTCGSKFPSYYFVHKHRKMCHSDELTTMEKVDGPVNNDGRDEEENNNSNCSSAQIDVEGDPDD